MNRTLELVVVDDRRFSSACLAKFLREASFADGLHVVEMDPADPIAIAQNAKWRICILSVGRDFSDDRWRILVRLLRESEEDRAVVVMADSDDPSSVRAAFEAGAKGYILTTLNPRVAVGALKFIAEGGTYFPLTAIPGSGTDNDPVRVSGNGATAAFGGKPGAAVPSGVPKSGSAPKSSLPEPLEECLDAEGDDDVLTPRQHAVLKHLCDAKSNKEIARLLTTTEATVKVHVRQIMRKLGAKNRTEAALIASRSKVVESTSLTINTVATPLPPREVKPRGDDPLGLRGGNMSFPASLAMSPGRAHRHVASSAK